MGLALLVSFHLFIRPSSSTIDIITPRFSVLLQQTILLFPRRS
jgi:hypothetical protein